MKTPGIRFHPTKLPVAGDTFSIGDTAFALGDILDPDPKVIARRLAEKINKSGVASATAEGLRVKILPDYTMLKRTKPGEIPREYLRQLARLGGLSTSAKKAEAARTNGAMPVRPGSRPRGRPKKGGGK